MHTLTDLLWECGKGWWSLIEKDSAAINPFNAAHPASPVEVSQIKQKFGGLRIYHYNASEDIRQLIDKAIEASWHTSERCGATEGIPTNVEGYRLTLCADCRKEIKPRIPTEECFQRCIKAAKKVYLDYRICRVYS